MHDFRHTLPTIAPAASLLAFALALFTSAGCDDAISLENAAPRLTWVLVTPDDDGATANLSVWISDAEGNSVDVNARWMAIGGGSGDVVQVMPAFPWTGRVTRDALLDPNGQEQRFAWDLATVPAGQLQLAFDIDDDPTDDRPADRWMSPVFDPRVGLQPAGPWTLLGAD